MITSFEMKSHLFVTVRWNTQQWRLKVFSHVSRVLKPINRVTFMQDPQLLLVLLIEKNSRYILILVLGQMSSSNSRSEEFLRSSNEEAGSRTIEKAIELSSEESLFDV